MRSNVDEYHSYDVGSDTESEEASVDSEDDMSELTKWPLVDFLGWKDMYDLHRSLVCLVRGRGRSRCDTRVC